MDKIDEVLTRRVDKIYPSREALEKTLRSGKKLRLHFGIDPTSAKLHLGHTIPLRVLQSFADLGHEAILLFGTGTVLAGDPSERNTGRKLITEKEIQENIKTWKEQVKPIIDFDKVKVRFNGDWLTKLSLKEIIKIGSQISAVQLFKRDSFTRRIKAGDTVWYHETMYPLLQGYDSVVMDVDLEIGGTDQTFNMLIGRELQRKMNGREKLVLTVQMMLGTDGKTMSKTSNNTIDLLDSPKDMFGKTMSLIDEMIIHYFEFVTDLPITKINKFEADWKSGRLKPMELKKKLAFEIVKRYHTEKQAQKAQTEFERVFQKKQTPSQMPVFKIKKGQWGIVDLLVEASLVPSRSEAKRLIQQGAVRVDRERVKNAESKVKIKEGVVLQVGKRKFVKLKTV